MSRRQFVWRPVGGLVMLLLSLAACTPIHRSSTRGMESELSLAGFKVLLADTSEKQQMLHTLPAKTVTRVDRPDNTYYIYADPDLCSCLYVGRQAEYDRFTSLGIERQISNEQLMANEMAEDRKVGWGPTGPWGYWGWGSGGYAGGYGAPTYGGSYYLRPAWDPW